MSAFWNMLGGILGPTTGVSGIGYGGIGGTQAAAMNAQEARNTAQDARNQAQDIKERLDRLTLLCMAMWELMKQSGLTEEQLAQKVKELDLADGRLDGKLKPAEMSQCSKCGRVMSRRHHRCLYCGNEDLECKPFDAAL